MTALPRLSVNLNKIALLRNSRHTGVPDLLKFAALVRESGADGLTVHPRPDERHITKDDVLRLAEWMESWRPEFELNVEGYPDERLLQIVDIVRPEQCSLVPDSPTAFTSDRGWNLSDSEISILRDAVPAFRAKGCRIILFADPDPSLIPGLALTGTDGVEIYTGSYAAEFRAGNGNAVFENLVAAANEAQVRGLQINIGHDLNLKNLSPLMKALPPVVEASIGHELMADALEIGFANAVRAYRTALRSASLDVAKGIL